MNKALLIEYGNLLKEHFNNIELLKYFLATVKSDEEVEQAMHFLKNKKDATDTDLDEFLINARLKRKGH